VSAGTPLRVLLVDDSIDERERYAEYLRTRGFCTLQAATAHDGFRMAADLAPAVVVTDIKLPGSEDGLALTSRLKHDERFLPKPCEPAELEAAVVEMVGQRA